MTVDHIVPHSQGGTDHEDNLQLLCGACNSTKGTNTQAQLIARLKEQGVLDKINGYNANQDNKLHIIWNTNIDENKPMQYDKNRYKIHALPHPLVFIWILNPLVIIHELILGVRLPKVTLIDKESCDPLMERSYVPCPHCETINDGRIWMKAHALGHWYGFVCPNCEQIIPCLWSLCSYAILIITFPLWYFPIRFFRDRWIVKEKARLAKVLERPLLQANDVNWKLIGTFFWGGFMWLFMVVIPEVWNVMNGEEWNLKMLFVFGLPFWLVAGFGWGLWMHIIMNKKGKKRG